MEVAILRAAERQRHDARRRDRHGVGVEHARRALDRENEPRRANGDPAHRLLRADGGIPAQHVFTRLDLRQENPGNAFDADHRVEIGLGQAGLEPVDAHPDPLAAELRRILLNSGPGVRLLGHRHRVLEIEQERVRRQPQRLVEKLLAIGRHVEEAAGQGHENYSAAATFGCGAASLVTPAAASLPIAAVS